MTTIPPSPVVIVLFPKKLKVEISPNVPTYLPLYLEPKASAQSSITNKFLLLASSTICSISHGCPYKWTHIIALVLLVIFCSMSLTDICQVSLSESTKMGVAPVYFIALTDAIYVSVGTITSSPSDIPNANKAK